MLSFGEMPTAVDDVIVKTIQSQVGADGLVRIGEQFKPGDHVIVKGGPLKSLTAIFERERKDSERVVILLNSVNYQAHLQVNRAMISRAG